MYIKTARITIPTEDWFAVGMKIDRYRLATLLNKAAKANQLDNWNRGDTTEGDSIFEPHTAFEKRLWTAIREENKKLFQRSLAGRQPRDMHKNLTSKNESV